MRNFQISGQGIGRPMISVLASIKAAAADVNRDLQKLDNDRAQAIIAASFERIHRSNLVGLGVLPLQFKDSENATTLGLDGSEQYSITLDNDLKPGQELIVRVMTDGTQERSFTTICRLDTGVELQYFRNGGILHTVLRRMLKDQ